MFKKITQKLHAAEDEEQAERTISYHLHSAWVIF